MIKLVTSDIDGTLLLDGAWELDGSIFPIIRRLAEHGIAFAAASGRQHYRLRTMFEEVASDIFFICENGAVVFEGDTLLSQTALPQDKAHELIAEILAVPELEVLISGAENCYLIPKTEEYVCLIRDQVKYRTEIVANVCEIPETIIKVSAYRKDGAAVLKPRFAPTWGKVFNMAIAGFEWLDFTLSDKGTGLADICNRLGISEQEVMSFGDNFNDLPLLSRVGVPYIMEGAPDELKAKFPRHCSRVEETLTAFLGGPDKQA